MKSVTICLTYFKSLALANLEAALYSVRRQNMSRVNSIVIVDNNTDDSIKSIQKVIEKVDFHVPVCFSSFKHRDSTKTHAWSTNAAVRRTNTSWVFFTRADYLLEVGVLDQFIRIADSRVEEWHGYITSFGMHLHHDIGVVNQSGWRDAETFPAMPGTVIDYSVIDTGVWMMPRKTFELVDGLDERLTAWGHAQTYFQWQLYLAGVEAVCVPKVLFYHPLHSGERDLDLANSQLSRVGADLREMWQRSPVRMYG